tara:strand:+ start:34411 stop:34677 length:267 start_codon:yes stop_codon:yes gene_type:complete
MPDPSICFTKATPAGQTLESQVKVVKRRRIYFIYPINFSIDFLYQMIDSNYVTICFAASPKIVSPGKAPLAIRSSAHPEFSDGTSAIM